MGRTVYLLTLYHKTQPFMQENIPIPWILWTRNILFQDGSNWSNSGTSKRHVIADLWLKQSEVKKNILWTLDMDVSENSGTPKSSISIGFSIVNHPFWGTPNFWKNHIPLRSKTNQNILHSPSPVYLFVRSQASLERRSNSWMKILKPKKNGPYQHHLRGANMTLRGG